MRRLLTAAFFVLYSVGATAVYAAGGCHSICADGYTYSKETGTCVPKEVSS